MPRRPVWKSLLEEIPVIERPEGATAWAMHVHEMAAVVACRKLRGDRVLGRSAVDPQPDGHHPVVLYGVLGAEPGSELRRLVATLDEKNPIGLKELRVRLGVRNVGEAHQLVRRAEKAGWIRRKPGRRATEPTTYEVTEYARTF